MIRRAATVSLRPGIVDRLLATLVTLGALAVLTATAVMLTRAAPALAEPSSEAQGLEIHEVDADDHPEVTVTVEPPVSLLDEELSGQAFELAENGEPREAEIAARSVTNLEVVLAVDTSGSVEGEPLAALREAAAEFVAQMPPATRIGLVAFDDRTHVVQAPTTDHDAVTEAIQSLSAGRGTALYDAVPVVLEQFGEGETERAAVLFADGQDSHSEATLDDAVSGLEGAGVPLHVVELFTDARRPQALQALADATDGELVATDDAEDLSALYEQVASALVHHYELTYESEASGEAELTVAVDHDGVVTEDSHTAAFPAEPAPPETRQVAPGFWSSTAGLVLGIGFVYVALATGILVLLAPRRRAAQLAGTYRRQARDGRTALSGVGDRLVNAADESLQRRGKRGPLNQALERAGIALRAGELVVLTASGAFAAWAVGTVLVAWWFGLVLAGVAVLATRMVIKFLAGRRQRQFVEQLSDTLQMLSGGLRAGYGLQQALDAVAREAGSPTAEEVNRVLVEARLGRDLMDALTAMAERMGSEDFDWVVQAIAIHREIGGDLAEVLDTVAATVRERARIRRQVKALSAEGRLSAVVLFGLPFAVGGFIFLTNPDYLSVLTSSLVGVAMLGAGAVLLTAGGLWLRSIVDLEY